MKREYQIAVYQGDKLLDWKDFLLTTSQLYWLSYKAALLGLIITINRTSEV